MGFNLIYTLSLWFYLAVGFIVDNCGFEFGGWGFEFGGWGFEFGGVAFNLQWVLLMWSLACSGF